MARVKSIEVNEVRARAARPARRMVANGDQCRCHCGSMLARMVRDGLELKCRKCKSLVLITHEELIEMYRELNPAAGALPALSTP
jgi:phage FluMu protein Com